MQRLFDELDDNQSYQLDFREFKRWLNGSDAGGEQLHDPGTRSECQREYVV